MMDRANLARTETAEFRHKAVLVLAERGWTTCAIAECLEISERSVRSLRKRRSEALEAERRATRKREARERYVRVKQRNAPFEVMDYLKDHSGGILNANQLAWLVDWKSLRNRDKIKFYLQDNIVSQAQMARLLGISRPAVSKHVKTLKQGSSNCSQ